jgi:hypothetical protein
MSISNVKRKLLLFTEKNPLLIHLVTVTASLAWRVAGEM